MPEPPPGGEPVKEPVVAEFGDAAAATAGPASAAAIRVVLADDSVLFREGLARVLAENGFVVAGQAGDADGLHAALDRETPDVVVTDIRMPPTNTSEGLLAAQRIRVEHPGVGVLVLSQYVETRQAVKLRVVGVQVEHGGAAGRGAPRRTRPTHPGVGTSQTTHNDEPPAQQGFTHLGRRNFGLGEQLGDQLGRQAVRFVQVPKVRLHQRPAGAELRQHRAPTSQ